MASINKSVSSLATLVFRIQNEPLGPKIINILEPNFIKHREQISHIDLSYITRPYANHPSTSEEMKNIIVQRAYELRDKLEPFNILNILPHITGYKNTNNLFNALQNKILSFDWSPREVKVILGAYAKVEGGQDMWRNIEKKILDFKNELDPNGISVILYNYTKRKIKTQLFEGLKANVMMKQFESNDAVYTMHSYIKNEVYDALIVEKLLKEINIKMISPRELALLYVTLWDCFKHFNELSKFADSQASLKTAKKIYDFAVEIEPLIFKSLEDFHTIDLISILETVDKVNRSYSIVDLANLIAWSDRMKNELSIEGFYLVANVLAKHKLRIPLPLVNHVLTLI